MMGTGMAVFKRFALAAAVLIAGIAAASAACRSESFEDNGYIVCSFDLAETDLRLFWQHPDGDAFGTFTALAGHLEGGGERLAFAMNGGMYGEDYGPIGLYIENGRELARANTTVGRGRRETGAEFLQEAERHLLHRPGTAPG